MSDPPSSDEQTKSNAYKQFIQYLKKILQFEVKMGRLQRLEIKSVIEFKQRCRYHARC